MINRRILASALFVICTIAGCTESEGGNERFLRFQINEIDYRVEQPIFRAIRVRDDHFLMELTQQPASSIPGAAVQWQMQLGSIEGLSGRRLDLDSVDSTDGGPMSIFTLTPDLNAYGQGASGMTIQLDSVTDDVVEGTFTGTRFLRISMTEEGSDEVDVSVQFRAALDFQP